MRLEDFRDETCAWCSKPFEGKSYVHRFCCRPCKRASDDYHRNRALSEAKREARSGYVCPECGSTFDAKFRAVQIYCSKRCKTREMLRRYRARLGEEEYQARRLTQQRRYKAQNREKINAENRRLRKEAAAKRVRPTRFCTVCGDAIAGAFRSDAKYCKPCANKRRYAAWRISEARKRTDANAEKCVG